MSALRGAAATKQSTDSSLSLIRLLNINIESFLMKEKSPLIGKGAAIIIANNKVAFQLQFTFFFDSVRLPKIV